MQRSELRVACELQVALALAQREFIVFESVLAADASILANVLQFERRENLCRLGAGLNLGVLDDWLFRTTFLPDDLVQIAVSLFALERKASDAGDFEAGGILFFNEAPVTENYTLSLHDALH